LELAADKVVQWNSFRHYVSPRVLGSQFDLEISFERFDRFGFDKRDLSIRTWPIRVGSYSVEVSVTLQTAPLYRSRFFNHHEFGSRLVTNLD